MSAETQSYAFKQDLEKAVKDAHSALDEALKQLELYLAKVEAENAPVLPVAPPEPAPPVPEVPVVPSAKIEQPPKPTDSTPDPAPGTGTSIPTPAPDSK